MNNLILFVGVMLPVAMFFGALAVVFGRLVDADARYRQHAGEDGGEGWSGAHKSADNL